MANRKKNIRRRPKLYEIGLQRGTSQRYEYEKARLEEYQQKLAEEMRDVQDAADITKNVIGDNTLEPYKPVEQNRRDEELTNTVDDSLEELVGETSQETSEETEYPGEVVITPKNNWGGLKEARDYLSAVSRNIAGNLHRYENATAGESASYAALDALNSRGPFDNVKWKQGADTYYGPGDLVADIGGLLTAGGIPGTDRKKTAKNIRELIIDNWSNLGIDKNKVEISTAQGDILLSKEKLNYISIYNQFLNNCQAIQKLSEEIRLTDDATIKQQMAQQIEKLEKANDILSPIVEQASTYSYENATGSGSVRKQDAVASISYSPSVVGYTFSNNQYEPTVQDDMKAALKAYRYYRNKDEVDYGLFKNIDQLRGKINRYNDYVNKTVIPEAIRSIKRDMRDIEEWKEWHVPSEDFLKKKEKAMQDFKFLNIDTYLYGLSGLIGSSAANNGYQLGAQVSRMVGSLLLNSKNPYAMAAGGALEIVGTGLGFLGAETENKAELAGAYEELFRNNLLKNNLLEKFIEDYRKQSGKKDADFSDALNGYITNQYNVDNVKINEIASNSLWGANNFFQDDMVATYGSELFDTGISMFVPMAGKGSTLLKAGGKYSLGNKLQNFATAHPGAKMFTDYAQRVLSNEAGYVAGATINPVVGMGVATLGPLVSSGVKKAFSPVAKALVNKFSFLGKWALTNPAAYMAKHNLAKKSLGFIASELGIGFSESIEEGKQHINAERFKRGEYKGDSRDLFESIMSDIETGSRAAYTFIGDQFFGLNSDPALAAEMRAGFLGPFTNAQVMLPVASQFGEIFRQYTADQIVAHNVMAMKFGDRLGIQNAIAYAKAGLSPNRARAMENGFDQMEKIHSKFSDRAKESGTEPVFTPEDVEVQRLEFHRIADLANSRLMKAAAAKRGIKVGSDDYNIFVALYNYGEGLSNKTISGMSEIDDHIEQVLSNIGLSRESFDKAAVGDDSGDLYQQLKKLGFEYSIDWSSLDKFKDDPELYMEYGRKLILEQGQKWILGRRNYIGQVAELHALLESIEQLENVENPTEAQKEELKDYKEGLKNYREDIKKSNATKYGLDKIDNIQDIESLIADKSAHDLLKDLYRQRFKFEHDLKGQMNFLEALAGEENIELPALNNEHMFKVFRQLFGDAKTARKNTKAANVELNQEIQGTDQELQELSENNDDYREYFQSEAAKDDVLAKKASKILNKYKDSIKADEEYIQHIYDYNKQLLELQEEALRKAAEEAQREEEASETQEIPAVEEQVPETTLLKEGEPESTGVVRLPDIPLGEGRITYIVGDKVTFEGLDYTITEYNPELNAITIHKDGEVDRVIPFNKFVDDILATYAKEQGRRMEESGKGPEAPVGKEPKPTEDPEEVTPVEPEPEPAEAHVERTEKQAEVESIIRGKIEADKNTVQHTGRDYFRIIDGKLVRFNRIHSILEEQFPTGDSILRARNKIITDLKALFNNKEAYKAEIIRLQNEYNKYLENTYGKDSDVYKRQKLDLSLYYHPDIINDMGAIRSIANLAAIGVRRIGNKDVYEIDIPARAVVAGDIIDFICREVFNNREVVYDSKFGMPERIFNKLISDIKERKAQYERDGYVLIAENINWYGEFFLDGKPIRLAGETDMIAIDKNGNIKIIDFKTAKRSFYQLMQRVYIAGEPTDNWVEVRPGEKVDDDVETRIENLALTYKSKTQLRSAEEFYTDQQAHYAILIQKGLAEQGCKVIGVELLPFYVRTKAGINAITNEQDRAIFGGFISNTEDTGDKYDMLPVDGQRAIAADYVEMQNPVPLQITSPAADRLLDVLEESKPVDLTNVNSLIADADDKINTLESIAQANKEKVTQPVNTSAFNTQLEDLKQRILTLRNDVAQRTNPGTVQALENDIKRFLMAIDQLVSLIQEQAAEYDARIIEEQKAALARLNDRFHPHKRMYGDGYKMFTTLWNNRMPQDLKLAAVKPDFATSAVVTLDVDDYLKHHGTTMLSNGMRIVVNITYGGTTWHDVPMLLQEKDDEGNPIEVRNGHLVQAIDSLLYTVENGVVKINKENAKKKIVLTGIIRTNGQTKYRGLTDLKGIAETFNLTEDDIRTITVGNDKGILAITKRGSVAKLNNNVRKVDIIHPIEQNSALVNGMLVFEMNMGFEEDGADKAGHSVPIILTPKQLGNTDIDLIIDCLRNFGRRRKIVINGKEYDSPLTNKEIVQTLIRFGKGAESTGNDFVFRFANVDQNGRPVDYKSVVITGVDKPLMLDDEEDISLLKEALSKLSVYYNNENVLLHNLAYNRDQSQSNVFKKLETFFRTFNGDKHEKIDRIELSESMVFDRSDVDPNGDGSYRGSLGAEWMMKNGWINTNFDHMENPLVALTGAEVVDESVQQEEKLMSDETNDKDDQIVDGSTIIEGGSQAAYRNQSDDTTDDDDPIVDKRVPYNYKVKNQINVEDVKRRLSKIIGKTIPLTIVDDLIDFSIVGGWKTLGRVTKSMLWLSKQAESGTEYHEAFHVVLELLLPEGVRNRIYEHYRKKYGKGKHLTDRQVTEDIADMFMDFRNNTGEFRFDFSDIPSSIKNFFKTLVSWYRAVRDLKDYKLAALFTAASSGAFKYIKISEKNIDRFDKTFKFLDYRVKGADRTVTFENLHNARQLNEAVDHLLYEILTRESIDQLGLNLDRLNTSKSYIQTRLYANKKELAAAREAEEEGKPYNEISEGYNERIGKGLTEEEFNKKTKVLQRDILIMRELMDNYDVIQPMIIDKLKEMNIKSYRQRNKQRAEDMEGGTKKSGASEDILGHSDEFFDHSRSDDVNGAIRIFLSTIPALRYATEDDVKAGRLDHRGIPLTSTTRTNKEGKVVRNLVSMKTNSLGYTTFLRFNDVYQRLLRMMHDVKNVEDLDAKLQKAKQDDYVMFRIAKAFHNFRFKSYIRYSEKEFGGKYVNVPKVLYKGKLLDPEFYVRDSQNLSDKDTFPVNVVAVQDFYYGDKLVCAEGEVIPGAIIITNPDFETYTTLMFQAIKSQKLDFTFCYDSPAVDEDGNSISGGHQYSINSTNSEQSQKNYPFVWFNNIRSLYGAVISGEKRSVKEFGLAAAALRNLASFIPAAKKGQKTIRLSNDPNDKKRYDLYDTEDFDKILSYFTQILTDVGIIVDRFMLLYMLQEAYPYVDNLQEALKEVFSSSAKENSIWKFIQEGGVLDTIQKAFDDKKFNVITDDLSSKKSKDGKNDRAASGANMYAENAFVKFLSLWYGRYRSSAQEMMTLGPDNTKLYMFALNHAISDMLFELKQSLVDEDENVSGSEMLSDFKDVDYISYVDENKVRRGSIVIKSLMQKNFDRQRLQLHTAGGVKRFQSAEGGVKYSEITAREDYINKMEILAKGGLIFPALSDKSTYFYITGFELPGFDWATPNAIKIDQLPFFGHGTGTMYFASTDKQNNFEEHALLDQLIEYAYCDYRNALTVLQLLENNDIEDNHKVKNIHTEDKHGARLAFLLGIYNEKGEYISFSNKNNSPKENLLKAYTYFFEQKEGETPELLRGRQRAIMARILQHRLDDQLDSLVKRGVIEFDEGNTSFYINGKDPKTQAWNKVPYKMPRYFGYKNKYLDAAKIKRLADMYGEKMFGNKKFKDIYTREQLESLAIVAYVNDSNAKSNISLLETLRIFTGLPHGYKWKYNKNGELSDIGFDESKRYGGAGSTGSNNRDDLPNIPDEYTCAEIKDWEVASPMKKYIREGMRDNEIRDVISEILRDSGYSEEAFEVYNLPTPEDAIETAIRLLGDDLRIKDALSIAEDLADGEASSFEDGINVADGTAFITDKMAENLLRQRGAFSGKVVEAFDYLRGDRRVVYLKDGKRMIGSYMSDYKAYKIIHEALISIQKYSAFGYRMENGQPIHFYNKFALFPIFKGISYGLTFDLYEKMNKEGVDMVMFDSAVKSGSEGAQEFNPDVFAEGKKSIDDFTFKGHTYKQKYKFIRRQLNTDPRESETQPIGTQAGKIIMSSLRIGQSYDVNGETRSGEQVRDRIMEILNKLSDNGLKRIEKLFLNENGTLNVEKFHNFIKGELMQRNADKNILDAIELEYDYDDNGKVIPNSARFRSTLNAVSNMEWIESILISRINSEVIDVSFPGNAFYQRSVFGMEGNPRKIMSDDLLKHYQINEGKPLQMINEDGSMDAVISIDYFLNLVPENIRYNFKKARLWLIDNKIIGPEAKANTIGYRIPTQAASSIHALRFVDVLPIVRDTIVLPKEFTKITGSDFKQY